MALITGLGLFVLSILSRALSSLAATELKEWNPSIIKSLIGFAVRRLPRQQRERFAEEWQSYINEVPGQIAKLVAALGFTFAALEVNLIDRRKAFFDEYSNLVAATDAALSGMRSVVSVIRNDLPGDEALRPKVDALASLIPKMEESRKNTLAKIEVASVATQGFTGSLSVILFDFLIGKRRRRELLEGTNQIKTLSDNIVVQFERAKTYTTT
jgi:hypothetical protein